MKKVLAILASVTMLISILCITSFAAAVVDVSVGTVSGAPGETVEVPVVINSNGGIWGFQFEVSYDTSVLTYKSLTVDPNASAAYNILPPEAKDGKFNVQINGNGFENYTVTGALAKITFEIAATAAAGDYALPVSWLPNNCIDWESNEIESNFNGGKVTVATATESDVSSEPDSSVAESSTPSQDVPANPDVTVSVGTATGKAGETVDVPVVIDSNKGIWGFQFELSYDPSVLTYKSLTIDPNASSAYNILPPEAKDGKFNVQINGNGFENYTVTGALAKITFEIAAGAADGDYNLGVTWLKNNCIDWESNEIPTLVNGGKVTVGSETSSDPVSSEPVSSEPVSSEPVSSEPVSSEPASSTPTSSAIDPNAVFEIQFATVNAKAGETVSVPVTIKKNLGIWGFQFNLEFDKNALEFVSLKTGANGSDFGLLELDSSASKPCIQGSASGFNNVTATGELAVLTFKVKDGVADGSYAISAVASEGSQINADGDDVGTNVYAGAVVLGGATPSSDPVSSEPVSSEPVSSEPESQPDPNASFEIEFATVNAKAGETVVVPVTVKKNLGIWGFQFDLSYDTNALEFVSLKAGANGTAFGLLELDSSATKPCIQGSATGLDNVTTTGELALITFKVKDGTADGSYKVTGTPVSGCQIDADMNDLICNVYAGAVVLGGDTPSSTPDPVSSEPESEINPNAAFDIKIGTVNGKAGETVTVPVTVEKNLGIWGFQFDLEYDANALEFVSLKAGKDGTPFGILELDSSATKPCIQGSAAGLDNVTATGELALITFKIKDGTADGTYKVSAKGVEGCQIDCDMNDLEYNVIAGAVVVGEVTPSENPSSKESAPDSSLEPLPDDPSEDSDDTSSEINSKSGDKEESTIPTYPTNEDEPAEDTPNTGSALPIAAIVLAISSAAVLTISRKK